MGYTGLDSIEDSDDASDCADMVIEELAHSLEVQLEEDGNEYNTNGPVNVALFFESFILPAAGDYINYDYIKDLARATKDKLKQFRDRSANKEWNDEKSKEEHIKAYDRMLHSLSEFLTNDWG